MDSEDEYDYYNSQADDEVSLEDDIDKMLAEQAQNAVANGGGNFSFRLPDVVKTPGFEARGREIRPLVMHEPTVQRVLLKHFDPERRAALETMLGDYDDLEQVLEPIVFPDGCLKKAVLQSGFGDTIKMGDLVWVHYILCGETMDDFIESTYIGDRPRRYRVGSGEMIGIMEHGLPTMCQGETSKFLATSEFGFGKLGVPLCENKVVPPDVRVVIQIEVMNVRRSKTDINIAELSSNERLELPFEKMYNYTKDVKKDGNDEFKNGEFGLALAKYIDALECARETRAMTMDEKDQVSMLKFEICNNLSFASFKLGKFKKAYRYANDGLRTRVPDNKKTKAYFRSAMALYELGRFTECSRYIDKAYALNPIDDSIKDLKAKTAERLELCKEQEKELCARMMAASVSKSTTKD